MSAETEPLQSDNLSQTVIDYLSENPDFFNQHEELLIDLKIPHPSGQAVSLLERQVHVLRDQLNSRNTQLNGLIEVARDNEALTDRMHLLTLSLIGASSFDEVITALQDGLFDHFQADAVELRLFSAGELDATASMPAEKQAVIGKLKEFLDNGRPVCGLLDPHQLEYIFGSLAESTRSSAIIPIHSNDTYGILAIGSRSEERFSTGKGTLFLSRLGEMVSRSLETVSLPGI